MLNKRADKLELIRIAEAVALEKSIDKDLIISSMENGIAKAAKSKFGSDNEIKVEIDRESGDIGIFRKLLIVENPENSNTEIKLEDARSSLDSIGIDENGLENMDRKILKNLIVNYNGGPTGGKSLAISINEDIQTIEDVYEPYLIKEGFIERTSRGRIATDKAYALFDLKK